MEKLEQEKKKTREVLDMIVTSTFTRFANLTSEEFLKEIGKSSAKSERKATKEAKFALISAITKDLVVANQRLELLNTQLKFLTEGVE